MQQHVTNIVSKLRKKKKVTQEELAQKIGVSRQTVVAIEKGSYVPSLLLGLKIAKFFHKLVEEIFTLSYEK